MTWNYIRNHKLAHVLICLLYSLLLFVQLILMGNAVYESGVENATLARRTYTFDVTVVTLDKLSEIRNKLPSPVLDMCVIVRTNNGDVVSYPNTILEDRVRYGNYEKILSGENFGYSSESAINSMTILFEENEKDLPFQAFWEEGYRLSVNGVLFTPRQLILEDTYLDNQPWRFYCSIEHLLKFFPQEEKYSLALSFPIVLSDREVSDVQVSVDSVFGKSEYRPSARVTEEQQKELERILQFTIPVVVLAIISFSTLLGYVLSSRRPEYETCRNCGATGTRIMRFQIEHVLVIIAISLVGGMALFLGLRAIGLDLIEYRKDSLLFYAVNLISFAVLVLIIASIKMCLGKWRNRNGYKRS